MRNVIDAIIYFILFYVIQIVSSLVFTLIMGDCTQSLVLGLGTTAVITILLFHFARFSPLRSSYIKSRPWSLLAWMALLALSLIAPLQYLEELIPSDMSSTTAATLSALLFHPLGFIIVVFLTPIAEEMVFRGGILRKLLSCVPNPWIAIVVTSIVFGIAHGNMPQFIHAVIIGILLGWTYWRTQSILPALVVHLVNNLAASTLCHMYPYDLDITLPEMFHGNLVLMYSVIAVSIIVAIVCLWRVVKEIKY